MVSHNQIACVCVPSELFLPPSGSNEVACTTMQQLGADVSESSALKVVNNGRVAVTGVNASSDFNETTKFLCAVTGEIRNLTELAHWYLPGRKDASAAELIGAMYAELQPRQLVAKLQGDWAIVGYDVTQERAFGARSGKGTIPLFQGKLANGSVVLSSFEMRKDEAVTSRSMDWEHALKEVPASHYIFGWRKLQFPLRFLAATDDLEQTKSTAQQAVLQALAGLNLPVAGLTKRPVRSTWHGSTNPAKTPDIATLKSASRMKPWESSSVLAKRTKDTKDTKETDTEVDDEKQLSSVEKGRSERCGWWRREAPTRSTVHACSNEWSEWTVDISDAEDSDAEDSQSSAPGSQSSARGSRRSSRESSLEPGAKPQAEAPKSTPTVLSTEAAPFVCRQQVQSSTNVDKPVEEASWKDNKTNHRARLSSAHSRRGSAHEPSLSSVEEEKRSSMELEKKRSSMELEKITHSQTTTTTERLTTTTERLDRRKRSSGHRAAKKTSGNRKIVMKRADPKQVMVEHAVESMHNIASGLLLSDMAEKSNNPAGAKKALSRVMGDAREMCEQEKARTRRANPQGSIEQDNASSHKVVSR